MSDDRKVPPGLKAIVEYYSALINIRQFWEAGGMHPLDWLKGETDRIHSLLQRELEHESKHGLEGVEEETRQSE